MILHFPNWDTLLLAMTSGKLPADALASPLKACWEDDAITINTAAKLSKNESSELKKVGVEVRRTMGRRGVTDLRCWHQLFSLEPTAEIPDILDHTAVLFELADSRQLPELVAEMLRLGNDRQSFRHLQSGKQDKTLLRVVGPPYYTLLRAIEFANGRLPSRGTDARRQLRAYLEQSSRVWVQVGSRHPLGEHIKPPAGQLLLMRGERDWEYVDEHPFQDIYELIDPQLPRTATSWTEAPCEERIEVPLRLTRGSANDTAELWVIRERALEQMEQLIRNSDDQLLSQLRFAVVHQVGTDSDSAPTEPVVILRTRPACKRPPVLVLDAVGYRQYLRLPNLFVPVGRLVHPPLRQNTLSPLLSADASRIYWLHPLSGDEFVPESVLDSAFRPLDQWVTYVLDHHREAMTEWRDSHQFQFDEFVCADSDAKQKKPPAKERSRQKEQDRAAKSPRSARPPESKLPSGEGDDDLSLNFNLLADELIPQQKSELQVQLDEVEQEFAASEEPIDSPWRREQWIRLGMLNSALENAQDTTICWSNALWDARTANDLGAGGVPLSPAESASWLRAELRNAGQDDPESLSVDEVLALGAARPLTAGVVPAYLVHAVARGDNRLQTRLGDIAEFLHANEGFLPIRTMWLAWHSVYQLSDGDTLGLARARDRILERLFQNGLAPEANLPSFLRARGAGQSDRFRSLLKQIHELYDKVLRWIVDAKESARTPAYAKLVFAFALARLGENGDCEQLIREALVELADLDEVHIWLAGAFEARIRQTIRGERGQPLPAEVVEQLETMDKMSRYLVDRLRTFSLILEPHERVDAFTTWHGAYTDQLSAELAQMSSIADPVQLRGRLAALLSEHGADESRRLRVLPKALELSPRLGEAFARDLLNYSLTWLDSCNDVVQKAMLLNRSIYIAAHFGQNDALDAFVQRILDALPKIVEEYFTMQLKREPALKERIDTIERLFNESFRDLRRMGMRGEIGRLYGELATRIEAGRAAAAKRISGKDTVERLESRAMGLLLCAAGGWYYFGQNEQAREVANLVRVRLLDKDPLPNIEQRSLAKSYASAVAQGSEAEALARIEELFEVRGKKTRVLRNIEDNMATSSHFSISQLELIETSVMALVNEDFSLSADGRRWLDEDEFLIRKRIHDDVRRVV
ncbi:MAG: hypothetical protein KDB14_09060 [Planctomycetales bacterium]|nr:hypothetical protein [Planctomycetales bacterium]